MTKLNETGASNRQGASRQGSIGRAVGLIIKEVPALFPVTVFLAVFEAASPYIGLFLSSEIVTELSEKNREKEHLFFLAILLVTLNLVVNLLRAFLNQLQDVLKYKKMKLLEKSIAEKSWQMDYETTCDPKVHEKRNMMPHWGYEHGIVALAQQVSDFLCAFFVIIISIVLVIEFFGARATGEGTMAGLLNHWMFPVVFILLFSLSAAYSIWSAAQVQKVTYQASKDKEKPNNLAVSIFESCCAEYQRGKDVRMFKAQGILQKKLADLYEHITQIQERASRFARKRMVLANLCSNLFNLFVYLCVGLKAIYGAFGAGSLIKYTGMVIQMGGGVEKLCNTIREFFQNKKYLDDYFEYLDMKNQTAEGTLPVTDKIRQDYELEFRNVTFTYPGVESPSLSQVCCKLKKGEKVAIVGRNGSGKTTFIKLLCRLYDPQEGEILLNGTDIKKYRYEDYLEFFSTVFQDFSIFAFQLGENVAAESAYEEESVIRALENAGFGERLKTLPEGLHTQLYKYFYEDGVELSGGEEQKTAIARCLYKDAPYAILDEPTAALDPVAEADIYQRMNQFIEGKGAIYISHRLSSCHFCQRIMVMDGGKLVETGTHEELLAADGLYHKLWHAQAKYYQS